MHTPSRRILIVEDDLQTTTVMARLVRAQGFSVITAMSITEARKCTEDGDIGFLISDIGFVDGTGWELMAELNRRWNIKGVAITGFGMEGDHERSRQAGFLMHLTKPITVVALGQILDLARQELGEPSATG